jgi:glyoxylate reductase
MKVFVTRKIPEWDQLNKPLVDAGYEVEVYANNHKISREELLDAVGKGCDGLVCLLTERIDSEVLERDVNRRLKVIANYAVGFDNIDVEACKRRGIVVTNTPSDVVNESVAEFAWTMILALAKNFWPAVQFAKNAGFVGWEPDIFLGSNLTSRTLGVVGAGRIGGLVVAKAAAFGMNVLACGRKSEITFEQVLAGSDIVSLHVPLTSETKHLMDKRAFGLMKKGAILVNTARGAVIDEAELLEALKSGQLGGAALDVWENEPLPRPELLEMSNVILTPHIASATWEARRAMGELVVKNIVEVFAGRNPINNV